MIPDLPTMRVATSTDARMGEAMTRNCGMMVENPSSRAYRIMCCGYARAGPFCDDAFHSWRYLGEKASRPRCCSGSAKRHDAPREAATSRVVLSLCDRAVKVVSELYGFSGARDTASPRCVGCPNGFRVQTLGTHCLQAKATLVREFDLWQRPCLDSMSRFTRVPGNQRGTVNSQ